VLHVEVCEDLWVPLPPSSFAALAGATILANLSASDITVGKADYRRLICASQSAKCVAAYLYSAAGPGESTTDLAWDGHALVYENGERLAESNAFPLEAGLITADIDLDHLRQERTRLTSFGDCVQLHAEQLAGFRRIEFDLDVPAGRVPLRRHVEAIPVRAVRPARRDERCAEVYDIQVEGLMKRLAATGLDKVVIGISGGLDSTQAALVAVAGVRPARSATPQRARLHAARFCDEPPHLRQRSRIDGRARHLARGDRHPAVGAAHARADRASVRARQAGL
jgi:NAD+ synthase (glutamine-hydrolysing)